MRRIRNLSLAAFALLAMAGNASVLQAHHCYDVSHINECASCGRDWFGTCYIPGGGNCGATNCNAVPDGDGDNCAGGTLTLCVCPPCA